MCRVGSNTFARTPPLRSDRDLAIGLGATLVAVLQEEGLDHYAVAMKDPEGNEFDIN
jgi:hypothetical protein